MWACAGCVSVFLIQAGSCAPGLKVCGTDRGAEFASTELVAVVALQGSEPLMVIVYSPVFHAVFFLYFPLQSSIRKFYFIKDTVCKI